MDLSRLQLQLQQPQLSPVESWNPPFCGDLPIYIDADGHWYHQGSKIARLPLVKLFASVLICQGEDYFLQTPVEKVRIQVADVPFLITQSQWLAGAAGPELWLTTNLGDTVLLSIANPLSLQLFAGQQVPYLNLWRGLSARLHRNVYYQLVEHAEFEESCCDTDSSSTSAVLQRWSINSAGHRFVLAEERVPV
ncbi:DUF1285 domain-containing protein [Alishewanella sp. d11]|uniref:DUF1285 domain-containing protein n=1 Tax=Alishewanella sp. d11 TaxID=3414030 RepID=UPI003BF77FCD